MNQAKGLMTFMKLLSTFSISIIIFYFFKTLFSGLDVLSKQYFYKKTLKITIFYMK
jgi:hypothetical protein